jgi:hypothetical protein
MLKRAVEDYVKSVVPAVELNAKVLIRVYANTKGMAKAYKDANILSEHVFGEFVQGFNMAEPLCDFVDAGTGKECADEKLKGWWLLTFSVIIDIFAGVFKVHIDDIHCQRVIFGGSADNRYARLLGPYSTNEEQARRVTLLDGPPFAKELMDFGDKFATTSFDAVFRKQKIQARGVQYSITPPASPSQNYATVMAQGLPPSPSAVFDPSGVQKRAQPILRNSKGQRVDSQLRYMQTDISNLKREKLCNAYQLQGYCRFVKCTHKHGPRLQGKQLEALRFVARLKYCGNGLACNDEFCTSGHQCPHKGCTGKDSCRFPKVMHGVDTEIV